MTNIKKVKPGPGDGSGREALLEATITVVANKGMRGLTFRAVAEEANVNNSLIAHHFGNRDGLIEAALDWAIVRSIQDSGIESFANDKERYTETLLNLLSTESEQKHEVFQYEMLLESRRNPDLAPKVLGLYRQFAIALAKSLAQVQQNDVNEARAAYTFAALDGLVLQRLAGVDEDYIRKAINQLWDDVVGN